MGVSPRTGDAHKGLCYKDLGAFLQFCPNAPREEAIASPRQLAGERLSTAELVRVPIPLCAGAEENPWQSYAGVWRDHPDFEAVPGLKIEDWSQ